MHSRIFQIESLPVDVEDRICADSIPEWFTGSIADYVSDVSDENHNEELEWLMSTSFGRVCTRDGDTLTFKIDIGDYFDEYFEKFKKAVDALSKIDFNQFVAKSTVCCGLDSAMYDLKKSYSDQFGFYVWNEDELYTMQQWMRTVEPLGTYYLGGVVDYHF